jgi:hypothetical protein
MMHEKEMEIIAKRKEEHLENERIKEQFSKELQVLSENLRKNLDEKSIKMIIKNNMKYLKKIEIRLVKSWRNKMYNASKSQNLNRKHLLSKMIAAPFSTIQQEQIYAEIKPIWLPNQEMQMKNGQFVELVLLPEVFILIYQKFFNLSKEVAESRIFNKGSMDPEDISPQSSFFIN